MKPKILRVWYSHRLDTQSCPLPEESDSLRDWRAGVFHYLGIQCKATILSKGKRITLASQGCWGVRSDDSRGRAGVEKEECDQLRDALAAQGFGRRAIAYAFDKITVEK